MKSSRFSLHALTQIQPLDRQQENWQTAVKHYATRSSRDSREFAHLFIKEEPLARFVKTMGVRSSFINKASMDQCRNMAIVLGFHASLDRQIHVPTL